MQAQLSGWCGGGTCAVHHRTIANPDRRE
jgi:hypothetical protein